MQKYRFDATETYRKIKRSFEVKNYSYRKLLILLFLTAVVILYLGPGFLRWLFIEPNENSNGE
jgi:hypothetical protein